tara:strand:+ start:115 stop:429 length:315 start_codon:yes stop_codon:yes gene_type:complete
MASFYNVTGSTGVTVELLAPNADNEGISSVLLTNVHATADATVTLFIQDDPVSGSTSTYNIIHTIAVPADSSLLLNEHGMFGFPDTFGLYITVGSSDTVDVIIN